MNFDKEATAVVLTALRLLQEEMQTNLRRVEEFPQIHEIDFEPISLEYIDELCEEINCAPECVPASALRRLVHAVDYDFYTDAPEYKDRVSKAKREIQRAYRSLKGDQENGGDLLRLIADMTMDGEVVDGNKWEMTSEDAIMTLNELIASARGLRGLKKPV